MIIASTARGFPCGKSASTSLSSFNILVGKASPNTGAYCRPGAACTACSGLCRNAGAWVSLTTLEPTRRRCGIRRLGLYSKTGRAMPPSSIRCTRQSAAGAAVRSSAGDVVTSGRVALAGCPDLTERPGGDHGAATDLCPLPPSLMTALAGCRRPLSPFPAPAR